MSNQTDRALIAAADHPMTLQFPEINASAVQEIKNSSLYRGASAVRAESQDRLLLTDTVTTNGWDMVSICRVSALNARIKAEKSYPEALSYAVGDDYRVDGTFGPWQVIAGGDGRNIHLRLPMENGTFRAGKDEYSLKGVYVNINVRLSYFPIPDMVHAKDGSYELKVRTTSQGDADPIASVYWVYDPSGKMDTIPCSILSALYAAWLNKPENLEKFNTLFSTVLINNMGDKSEDYKWLRATSISYAYTDKGSEDSSIFGVLCMTNDRSHEGLPNQLPALSLQRDDNAVFLINKQIFVKYQFVPALPYIFKDAKASDFKLDDAGTTITASNLKMDSVKYGAIEYHPVMQSMEITFDETYIRSQANIKTHISSGIDTYTTIVTKQTLALGVNSKGEQVMTYEMVGEPTVANETEVGVGIVITEIILGIIAAVVTGIAAAVASKVKTLIVGIIVAVVVAVIDIVIHVIIEKVVADGVLDNVPAITPMVKLATQQVKWPFCTENAFVLTDISYYGALVFEGNLRLAKGYSIVNNRLTYQAIPV